MYAILCKYYYYAGTLGRPADNYLTDDSDEILEFDTQEEAQAYIDDNFGQGGTYYLAHGEYAAPNYELVHLDARPADCVQVYKPGDNWGYRRVIRNDQIPQPIREDVVSANVDFDSSDGEIEEWTYQEEYNGNTYGITYFVRTEASQRAGLIGDMSNVDWDSPVYWVEYDTDEMTIADAEAYAAEVGQPVTGRNIRHAAKAGHIPGARKLGRDWIIPYDGMYHYLDNRPKRGPKSS